MEMPGWKKMAPGGLIRERGNAVEYRTGIWRDQKPVADIAKCTHCMICWLFCPEGTIETAEGKFLGFDLEHCKGCGICAVECPPKAIKMVPEGQGDEGDTP